MGESSFWYRPTRVVPDQRPLNGRCCCCCAAKKLHTLLMNDKWISCAVSPYSGGGCTATEFLCSVSHCCDNVTSPLSQDDHTGSSTDEYELDDVDDNTQPPVTNSSNTTAAASAVVRFASASRDVCLVPPHVKVALIPFCPQCIDTLIASNSHCPVCRGAISTTVWFYN